MSVVIRLQADSSAHPWLDFDVLDARCCSMLDAAHSLMFWNLEQGPYLEQGLLQAGDDHHCFRQGAVGQPDLHKAGQGAVTDVEGGNAIGEVRYAAHIRSLTAQMLDDGKMKADMHVPLTADLCAPGPGPACQ